MDVIPVIESCFMKDVKKAYPGFAQDCEYI